MEPFAPGAPADHPGKLRTFGAFVAGIFVIHHDSEADMFALAALALVVEFVAMFSYTAITGNGSITDDLVGAAFFSVIVAILTFVAAIPAATVEKRIPKLEFGAAVFTVVAMETRVFLRSPYLSHVVFTLILLGPIMAATAAYFVTPIIVAIVRGIARRWRAARSLVGGKPPEL